MADNEPIFDILLAQSNIEVNLKTIQEHAPLYYALLKYESGIDQEQNYASRLLDHGALDNPIYSQHCDSLLQVLALEGAESSAIFLTAYVKQNLNHVNAEGESALHTACLKNYPALAEKLLQLSADPNLLTNESRQTPLHYAVKGNSGDCIKVFIAVNEKLEEVNLSCSRAFFLTGGF